MAENINLEKITINKHSSIRIAASKVMYFDPFEIANEIHDADLIFITHEHFDHFDPTSIAKIAKDTTVIVAPKSMAGDIEKKTGFASSSCIFLAPNDEIEVSGVMIQAIPAYNKLKPFHMANMKWLGYKVISEDVTYYIAGDTDATNELTSMSGIDVALVPIGGMYTMDYKDAAKAIAKMAPKVVIPTHYGSIAGKATDGANFEKQLKILDENDAIEVCLKI